jgi:hypothetical protein
VKTRRLAAAALAVLAMAPGAAAAPGDLTFPDDESGHPPSWDYWWGAGRIVTESGNRYVIAGAYTDQDGAVASGYQLYPLQGPYRGQGVMTADGPPEWGHPSQSATRFVHDHSMALPGTHPQLRLDTVDTTAGLKVVDRWARTDPTRMLYQLRIDQADGKVHPAGTATPLDVDLRADMRDPPLLAGGTGRWFYGVPEDFGTPSRGYQYMQAARRLTGTLAYRGPGGAPVRERVDPGRSLLLMVHESDPPEDIPVALGLAASTQIHPRFAQYYNLQWPWELVFADLGNGAQLMFDLQGYHDTPNGTLRPATPQMPTYRMLATLRLPNGVSVPLDGRLHAEHLAYRYLDTIASVTGTALASPFIQAWEYRISFPGGMVDRPDGPPVKVPPFDLGFVPPFSKSEPKADGHGNRLTQRVPFDVTGSYDGCPVDGFAWSEELQSWYGWDDQDPWWTGGPLPATPKRCSKHLPPPPSGTAGNLNPAPSATGAPDPAPEQCSASDPDTPRCAYTAAHAGGLSGHSDEPGGWTVTIARPKRAEPYVVTSHGGYELYACGTVRPGDRVTLTAKGGSGANVFAGNPGICY